jgi:4-amino-4-deoxy-L-arabinose transferase-like glycosyltransferase
MAFAALCFYLGLGPSAPGPADWDDALYCDYAATGLSHFELRNRYVHVWGIRLVDTLVGSRRVAASVYSSAVTLGIGWLVFVLARRLGGTLAGVCGLGLTLLFPPILRYVSTPHVDPTMTFWALAALAATVAALESDAPRCFSTYAAVSGVACFLALESKESALPLPAIVGYLFVAHSRQRLMHLRSWAAGLCGGWLVLLGLDIAFTHPGQPWSSTPWHYFGHRPASDPRLGFTRVPDLRRFRHFEFWNQLTSAPYLACSFFGLAQMARSFRGQLVTKALTLWFFASVALTTWISIREWDIQVYDRYLIGPGVALVVLSAVWFVQLWQRTGTRDLQNLLWLVPMLAAALFMTLPALRAAHSGTPDEQAARALFFALPVTCLALFMTPWLTDNRWLPAISAVVLLGISGYASVTAAAEAAAAKRDEMRPWNQLAELTDHAQVGLAVWAAPKYPERRVMWRLRLLSRRAVDDVRVRTVSDAGQAAGNEWVFTGSCRRPPRLDAAFATVISGACNSPGWEWTVYARRSVPPQPTAAAP